MIHVETRNQFCNVFLTKFLYVILWDRRDRYALRFYSSVQVEVIEICQRRHVLTSRVFLANYFLLGLEWGLLS